MEHTANTERYVSWGRWTWICLLLVTLAGCETSNAVITGTPVAGQAAPVGVAPGIHSSSGGGAGIVGGIAPPVCNLATAGTLSAVPTQAAGTSNTAIAGRPSTFATDAAGTSGIVGSDAQTGTPAGASGPVGQPSAAIGCRASKYSLAVRLTVDVSWAETTGLAGGSAKAHFWSKLTIEPSASTVSEFRTCGYLMPVLRTSALAGNKLSFQQVPQATYDLATMPTLSGGSATRVDSMLTLDPGILAVGVTLTDPAAPWPTSSTDPKLMWVDADGDGKPGITQRVHIDDTAGFAAPPTSILQIDRIDAYYGASRTHYRAMLNDAACADALEGSAELLAMDNLLIGCHVKDKQDCRPEEFQFLQDGRPTFVFSPAAVVHAAVVPVDATCAQAVQVLDVPGP